MQGKVQNLLSWKYLPLLLTSTFVGAINVTIHDLMESGYLSAGEKVQFVFRNAKYDAVINPDGSIHSFPPFCHSPKQQ